MRENAFQRSAHSTIVRYQTTINRQLFQALNQLERLQRLRKGDNRDLIGGLPNNELDDWLGFDAIGNSC